MATNDDVSTDVTMASLAGGMHALSTGVQSLRAELTTMQNREATGMQAIRAELTALQNWDLSLDEQGRERPYRSFQGAPRPHNTKVQYFLNLPGENFWHGDPNFRSSLTTTAGPMRSQNNLCMRTWRAPPSSRWWTSPSPDRRLLSRPWMSTSAGFFRRATRSCCELNLLAWSSSLTNPSRSCTRGWGFSFTSRTLMLLRGMTSSSSRGSSRP